MNMRIYLNKCDAFWNWVEFDSGIVQNGQLDERNYATLDEWVSGLSIPDWEIGPDHAEDQYLALSPNGDLDILKLTDIVVSRAPKISGWKFYSGRPKKNWDGKFIWSIHRETIDINGWKALVLRYPDNIYEIIFLAMNFDNFSENEILALIKFIAMSELGEEKFIKKVCGVYFDQNPSAQDIKDSISVREIDRAVV